MKIEEKILFPLLDKLKKNELKEYLKTSFYEMNDEQKRDVFGEIYEEKLSGGRNLQKLYSEIKKFHEKSVNGDYYAPFMINSKNYSDIPQKTNEWFSELSYYLDLSSRLVEREEYNLSNSCFELLFDLVSLMENGEDIVFADEYGTWMIICNSDYNESYIKSLAKVENEEIFTEKVIPLLKRDSYESLSEKIYTKIRKYSTKEQLKRVEQEIGSNKIRVK